IWKVVPSIEITVNGQRGVPVRGYGLMLMLGIVAGVAVAIYRARSRGIPDEAILNLAFYLLVTGIVGARLFFVVQKWDQFQGDSLRETLSSVLKFTEGGLVVYGALIGAGLGFLAFVVRSGTPALPLADVIAPSLLIGLALGRVGCF